MVTFRQTTSDFLFAGNPMGINNRFNPTYASLLREAGMNHSYIFAPWETVEPSPGEFRWDGIDGYQRVDEQFEFGFRLMGGLSFWLYRGSGLGTEFCPSYQDRMSFPDLRRNVYEHMRNMACRYGGMIELWEFNEQNTSNALGLTWNQKLQLYRDAIAGLRSGNPTASAIFNGAALPYEFASEAPGPVEEYAGMVSFPHFLRMIIDHAIPVDVIGLEMYYAGINTDGYRPPGLSLVDLGHLLESYSAFGKPLYVTEFAAPSAQHPGSSWWRRPWDEATQDEFVRAVYMIAFSKAGVQQIGYSYSVSDENTFILSGGILDRNLKPKLAYHGLKGLLRSWRSEGTVTTDSRGAAEIRGFGGDYELVIATACREACRRTVHITERRTVEVAWTLPPADPAPIQLSLDIAAFLTAREGAWYSASAQELPGFSVPPEATLHISREPVRNRRQGQISPTLVSSYIFIQEPFSLTEMEQHWSTLRGLFLRTGRFRFPDYINGRAWNMSNHSIVLTPPVEAIVKECNSRGIPIFVMLNHSDFVPGPPGSAGIDSLVYADNVAATLAFLRNLRDVGLQVAGLTFGDNIGDDFGLGPLKPTFYNSDLLTIFLRFARAIKGEFPDIKIYAFETSVGAAAGTFASLLGGHPGHSIWVLLEGIRRAELELGQLLLDGFSFQESYVYMDRDGRVLDSQQILDDAEALYRTTPVYRLNYDGVAYPDPDRAYLPSLARRVDAMFGREVDLVLAEYLPAGAFFISEEDTSRYADIDLILHHADLTGIYALLGFDGVSRLMLSPPQNHKSYLSGRGEPARNYPVQEQLARFFRGQVLRVDSSTTYDRHRLKVYAAREGDQHFIVLLNKEASRDMVIRLTVPDVEQGPERNEGRRGVEFNLNLPRRSYTSLLLRPEGVVVSGIGGI